MPIVKLQPPALARYQLLKKEAREDMINAHAKLKEIRDRKLYECEYESWEEFAEKEFGWKPRHINEVIQAAEIVKALPAPQRAQVKTVKAAVALASVPPAKRADTVKKAGPPGKPVTAKAIKAAAPPPKQSKGQPQKPTGPLDDSGLLIPESLLPLWARRVEVQQLLQSLSSVRTAISKAEKAGDALFGRVSFNSIHSHIDQCYADILSAKPSYVCPACGGNPGVIQNCTLCKSTGLLSEFYWRSVNQELKDMRRVAVDKQNAQSK